LPQVRKAALTGESIPIKVSVWSTDENYHETRNLIFFGTEIVEGSVVGIVIRTGDRTVVRKKYNRK
jgi:sodium/potassium-transporting ATPase subunit alpha